MDTSNRALATWTTPQCRFTIEYSSRVLDDIRLAVTDAFFSLPRGGVEIGGILLGRHLASRVVIEGYLPLDCEHASGPSFVLSPNDQAKLNQLLAQARTSEAGPVGWYHSHTRSEIFLSPADIEVHRRFFPQPWQVALVIRPRTMGPADAGFFFYEADGAIRGESSYAEFTLEQRGVHPVPVSPPPPASAPAAPEPAPNGPVIDIAPAAEPPVRPAPPVDIPAPRARASASEPLDPPPAPVETPRFQLVEQESTRVPVPLPLPTPSFAVTPSRSRSWISLIAIAAGLALGAAGYQTRDKWIPHVRAFAAKVPWSEPAVRSEPPPAPLSVSPASSVSFSAIDSDGQLQLRWDRNSPLVRGGTGALLMITDGETPPQAIGLDIAHLQAGSFTYARQTGRVDVILNVHLPDGQDLKEIATFLGKPPGQHPGDDARQQEITDQASQLQKQAERTKKLERTIEDMRGEIRRQQRRLENQVPDAVKK